MFYSTVVSLNFVCVLDPIVSNIPRKIVPPVDTGFVDERVPETTEDTSVIMNPKSEDRQTSFFAQPGILAGNEIFLFYLTSTSLER